ncbi:MAG TPA: c-type cytochrome [Candidatus Elarobacter sp.]
MTARLVALAGAVLGLALSASASAQPDRDAAGDAQAERGRYLVQQVGMCITCHGSSLHGSRLDFLAPGLPAARFAPRIAGLPQLKTADAVTFFETGKLPNGTYARPPMPQYRLHHDDALAIARYLKSLP